MKNRLIILLIGLTQISFSQRIDSYSSLFEVNDSAFIRFSYDNDLFQAHDQYYTQGFSLEIINPIFCRNPINKLLINDVQSSNQKYGIRLESSVFTPSSITSDSILPNDRPYCGILSLSFLRMSYNPTIKHKVSSELSIGIIGPAALGREIQTGIHQLTNNTIPRGWQYQIKNDVLIDYRLRYEKQLFFLNKIFGASAFGETKLGTYQDNVNLGLNMHLGWKQSPYFESNKNFQLYLYAQSKIRLVAYDAGLLGGVFNRPSEYTVTYKKLNNIVLENHMGVVLSASIIYFGIDFGYISSEFSGSTQHSWGGLRLGFKPRR